MSLKPINVNFTSVKRSSVRFSSFSQRLVLEVLASTLPNFLPEMLPSVLPATTVIRTRAGVKASRSRRRALEMLTAYSYINTETEQRREDT